MKLTNGQIYNYILNMNKAFEGFNEPLPVKFNFYINKNQQILYNLAQSIEHTRNDIVGTEKNEELRDYKLEQLSDIEQEVNIKMIPVDWLTNDIKLTQEQLLSIMFMIEDTQEEEEEKEDSDD